MPLEEKMSQAAPGSGARHGKQKNRYGFAQTLGAALTSDEQDDRPTVPDTAAPPLVSKRRKARLARAGAAGKKTRPIRALISTARPPTWRDKLTSVRFAQEHVVRGI